MFWKASGVGVCGMVDVVGRGIVGRDSEAVVGRCRKPSHIVAIAGDPGAEAAGLSSLDDPELLPFSF